MSRKLPLRLLLFGTAALALGGGTIFLAQNLLRDRANIAARSDAGVQPVATTKILVAVKALPLGSSVKTDDLAWREWPATMLDPGYIRETPGRPQTFIGHIVRTEIVAGEPITAQRLVAPGARGTLAVIMQPGRRAVSINLNPTTSVSGLILPGDRVDVVLTYLIPRPTNATGGSGIDHHAADTILSDVLVLAVDQRVSNTPTDVKEIHNASLEVTAKQSETLALAADLGKLSLSLRGIERAGDAALAASSGTIDFQIAHLLPGLSAASASRVEGRRQAPAPTPKPAPTLVEFHGGTPNAAGSAH